MSKITKKSVPPCTYVIGILVVLLFAIAAIGKLFYPSPKLARLDFWVAIFEIILIVGVFLFYRAWQLWGVLALVFASWAGVSIFLMHKGVPCSCMGELFVLAKGSSLVLDSVFYILSFWMAYLLGCRAIWLPLLILGSLITGISGYFFGGWIYKLFLGL